MAGGLDTERLVQILKSVPQFIYCRKSMYRDFDPELYQGVFAWYRIYGLGLGMGFMV